jgi:ankyrin repeat protein
MAFDLNKLTNILNNLELRKSLEIVNLQDEQGYTVLHSAAYYNSFRIADFLITFFRRRLA